MENKKLILSQDNDYILGEVDVYKDHIVTWKTSWGVC